MQTQGAELHAVVFRACHQNAPRHHGAALHLPLLLDLRADETAEDLLILHRADHKHEVAGLDAVLGRRDNHRAVGLLDARDDVVDRDERVHLEHAQAVDHLVGDAEGRDVGRELRAFLVILDLGRLLLGVYLEDSLEQDHGEDDAYHAERISRRVTHRHLLAHVISLGVDLKEGLLRRAETRRVGHCTAHDSHKLRDGGVAFRTALQEIDGDRDADIERYGQHRQHVHLYAAFLERGEETGADLHTYRENEEYQSELTQEVQHVAIYRIAEVAKQDADEQNKSHAERDSENLDFPQIDACEYHERIEQDGACQGNIVGLEQFNQPFHVLIPIFLRNLKNELFCKITKISLNYKIKTKHEV